MSDKEEIKVGDRFIRNSDKRVLKVMAIIDNWCMVRYKGAVPFTIHINELKKFIGLSKYIT